MDNTERKLMDNRAWNFRPVVQPYRDNRTKRMEISTIIYI